MKSETIYEIMLSVLSGDATEDEHRLLNEWLACSEANRRQFEQVGELYRSFETVGKQDDSEYDVEQAWMRVRNQTVEKKKKFNLKTWLPYAALVAIMFSVGLYFMNRPAEQDWTAEADVLTNINQPTLLLDNGERIPLKQDSFSIQQGNMVIRNNLVGQLSYESDREQPSDEEKLYFTTSPSSSYAERSISSPIVFTSKKTIFIICSSLYHCNLQLFLFIIITNLFYEYNLNNR